MLLVPPFLIALVFVLFFAGPIDDIDFWWHVAAGRWIVESGGLPASDPFGVFGSGNAVRTATVLRGQWLGQVALHAVFTGIGAMGVVLLRAGALAVCVLGVHLRALRLGAGRLESAVVTVVVGIGLLGFTGERPQLFSFAFAVALAFFLDELSHGARWPLFGIPALGVAWANTHGAALLGVAVLGAHAVGEALRSRTSGRLRIGSAAAATVLFAGATLATPNGAVTWAYVLQTQGGELARRTTEYASALAIAGVGGWDRQVGVYAYFALAGLALPGLLRASTPRGASLLVLAGASAVSYRYHAFFLVMGAPWIARALPAVPPFVPRGARGVAIAAAIAATGILVAQRTPLEGLRAPVREERLPVGAVERLRAEGAEGKILAAFHWGGYLIWELAPKARPFVDPRMLDDATLRPYTHMIWATPEGMAAFESEPFTHVLLPLTSPTGEVYPLHSVLRARGDWRLEYAWPGGMLYGSSKRHGRSAAP